MDICGTMLSNASQIRKHPVVVPIYIWFSATTSDRICGSVSGNRMKLNDLKTQKQRSI